LRPREGSEKGLGPWPGARQAQSRAPAGVHHLADDVQEALSRIDVEWNRARAEALRAPLASARLVGANDPGASAVVDAVGLGDLDVVDAGLEVIRADEEARSAMGEQLYGIVDATVAVNAGRRAGRAAASAAPAATAQEGHPATNG